MRIHKIELKNFGQHERVTKVINGGVLGLCGANGSGKSTILNAIEWCITGSVSDSSVSSMSELVRFVGTSEAAKKAEVSMDFSVGSSSGTIYRSVSASGTSTRRLQWDGEEFKSAKDVDKIMNNILGADKKAISTVVCLKQGDVSKLLTSKDSERRDMFIRLLQQEHMALVGRVAKEKSKRLSDGIVDLVPQLDTLRHKRAEAMESLEVAETTFSSYTLNTNVDALRSTSTNMLNAERNTALIQSASQKEMPNIELLNVELESKELLLASGIESKNKIDSLRNSITGVKLSTQGCESALSDAKSRADLQLKREELMQSLKLFGHTAADIQAARDYHTSYERLSVELQKSNKRAGELTIELLQLQKPEDDEEASLQLIRQEHQTRVITLEGKIKAIESALECSTSKCPVCSSEDYDRTIMDSIVQDAKLELQNVRLELSLASKNLQTMVEANKLSRARSSSLTADIAKEKETKSQLETSIKSLTPTQIEASDISGLTETFSTLESDLVACNAVLNNIVTDVDVTEVTGELHKLKSTLTLLEGQLVSAEEGNPDVVTLEREIVALKSTVSNAIASKDRLEKLQEDQATLLADINTTIIELNLPDTRSEISKVLDEAQTVADLRESARGTIQTWKDVVQKLDVDIEGVERRIQDQKTTRSIIDDLQILQSAFSPEGITRDYLDNQFRHIADLTQLHLAKMDTNFVVRCSEESSLCFEFMRTDDGVGEFLPMQRLSGGQCMLLSIACLLAIQELIIPDVGLLILDEPTTHVDDAGVSKLPEVFNSMKEELSSTNSQIIICDHNPILRSAFDDVIDLNK